MLSINGLVYVGLIFLEMQTDINRWILVVLASHLCLRKSVSVLVSTKETLCFCNGNKVFLP